MFESTKIPDDWKEYLDSADKVLVPSKWCQEVFKKSGVESIVIPLGFDNQVFKYYERMNKRKAKKDFIFLHYNAFNIRKGFLELFKAFTQEFQKDEPVRLILKTNLRSIPIPINKAQYPNIDIIHEEMPEKDLVSLIKNRIVLSFQVGRRVWDDSFKSLWRLVCLQSFLMPWNNRIF